MSTVTQFPYDYEADIPVGYYDKIFKEGRGVRYMWHANKFEAVKSRIEPNAKNILDIGCGPGTFIGNFLKAKESVGVDLSQPQIQYANTYYGSKSAKFVQTSVQDFVSDNQAFDTVTCLELIEHIESADVDDLLENALQGLKPGGKAIFTTPNYGSLWPIIEIALNKVSDVSYEDQHINKYRRKRLKAQMERNGFENVRVTTSIGFGPFFGVFGNRVARAISSLERMFGHFGIGNLLVAEGQRPLT